jgi:hypothetical protein
VEEFDGAVPPSAVLAGLVDYVRALSPSACPAAASRPVTLAGLMDDVGRALAAAQTAPDPATAAVLVAAARSRLGLVDERYASLAPQRRALRAADRELAAIAGDLRAGRPAARARLARAIADSRRLEARLRRREGQSLFDFKTLQAAI